MFERPGYASPFDLPSTMSFAIDAIAEVAQVGEVIDRVADVEVHRIVDRGLRAQGVLFFEVLLDVRGRPRRSSR